MRIKFTFILLFLHLCLALTGVHAQITSSNISGIIKDDSAKELPGAIIRATHIPSGTTYGAASDDNGSYNIQNMRVGGPYKVEVTYTGLKTEVYNDIYLTLGETYKLNIKLNAEGNMLNEVVVSSVKDPIMNNQRTGAVRDISATEINTMPTISRSINDFLRLTPQSSGTSFMGQDDRYNNYQINGANFNNSFGLSAGLPGGSQPFSLDAIEEIQVAISDFDVRQTNFTGANINMVTRSGTNDFSGSAYVYYRDQSFNGTHVGQYDLPAATKNVNNIYGIRLGGPIIKNKLFFFINGEIEHNVHPGISPNWQPYVDGATGPTISRTPADSLQKLSNFLKNNYQYNTGAYANYANNFTNSYNRLNARLDWNINDKNKVDISFSDFGSKSDQLPNSKSAANGSLSNSRVGQNSLSFANTDYGFKDVVQSVSAELVSTISPKVSNQLLGTFTHVRDTRTSPSSQFPFIDIDGLNGSTTNGDNYMSAGYELFTYKNDVKYNTTTAYDNLTINEGINTITAGASFQYFTYANSYFPYGTSYYRYASLNDFVTNQAPVGFGYTYTYPGQDDYVKARYALGSAYLQDKVNVTDNFVITGGLRLELPFYPGKLAPNNYIDTLKLLNPAGDTTHYSVNNWPKQRILASPRLGFNWRPLNDNTLQVRGGTGIFVGQVPFVWFTNQPANSGTSTNNVQIASGAALPYLHFQPNVQAALAQLPADIRNQLFPTQSGNSVPGQIALISPNFKMPQVWRSDLSVDYKLPIWDLVATAEFMYTKDLVSVYEFNANLPKTAGQMNNGNGDSLRYYYPKPANGGSPGRIYPNISGVYVLENSTLGDAYSATIGISRAPRKNGFFGSIYYTRTYSEDITPNAGAQAGSTWQALPTLSSPNQITLSPSDYFVPNRIIANASYRIEYGHHFASTLSLVYEGTSGGRFSYVYYNDVNGDNIYYDLMYIPKDANELTFTPIKDASGNVLFTAKQEADAVNQYINQDKYLSKHKGEYATRNGAQYPYYGRMDLKFLEDIYTNIGKRRNTLQLSVDILNLGNLISRNWGLYKVNTISYGSLLTASTAYSRTGQESITSYKVDTYVDANGKTQLPTTTFMNSVSTSSVWGMQIGIRYIF